MRSCACVLLLGTVLLGPHELCAGHDRPDAQDFPKPLGRVIDTEENGRYHLFEIESFSAARVYGNVLSGYQLHVLRTRESGVAIAEVGLSPSRYERLQEHIKARVRAVGRGEPSPTAPVQEISDESWRVVEGAVMVQRRGEPSVEGVLIEARVDTLHVRRADDTIERIPYDRVAWIECAASGPATWKPSIPDRHDCRLFFAPTGRMLRKGEGAFTGYFIFLPTAWVGVSDRLMVGGGVAVSPAAISFGSVYGGAKAGARVHGALHLSLTTIYHRSFSADEGTLVAFGAASFGDRGKALTIGTPVAVGRGAKYIPPMFIGGDIQVAKGVKFVSENWFLSTGDKKIYRLFLAGFRFHRQRDAVDLGFASFDDLGQWHPLPWLSVSFSWDW
ncbi:hypothetical protein JXA88_14900 [Candidatus Fermentibacteria bacterium]|nr:hypothetical protein [Candidatus Fermentibacteria bacterium]